MICPLCKNEKADFFLKDKSRDYFSCQECSLVFVPKSQLPALEYEKAEYDLHCNSPDDQGYRKFLSRIFDPILKRLKPGARGLDFGSGPGPTLSVMLEESGLSMAIYDYFYANNPSVFDEQYDFIVATEVLEHLHCPAEELERLWNCLKQGGTLGIMTQLALDKERFANWRYKADMTHVRFFSRPTFEWLAAKWHAELEFVDKDVIFLSKTC